MVIVADGTKKREKRLKRVLTTDPGIGIARHVDAGYTKAIKTAMEKGVKIPD
jgi:urocanate hydratase